MNGCDEFVGILEREAKLLQLTPPCVRGRRVCARASAAAARVAPVRIDYKGEVIHSQTLSALIIRKRSQLSSPSVHLCHTML